MLSILYIGVFLSIANAQSFYLGQRWPVYSETSTSASGPSGGTITRYSTRFYDELVKNTNANIVFKKEEGTDADQYMTPRCSERANTLATLVSQEWSGKRLRVTEAWDEDDEHSTNSLHYSGRALDITTSDIDQSKYGRLAQLAADASFDWVYYEASNHVHVSCKAASCSSNQFQCSNGQCIPDYWYCDGFNDCDDYSDEPNSCSCTSNQFQCDNGDCIPSYWECDNIYDCSDYSDEGSQCSSTTTSAPSSPGSCFPPTALAQTEDGPIPVKDLKLGSSVLALSSSGALVYSPVIAMLDAKDDEVVNYTIIRTVDHHQIVLTPAHLIYKTDYNDKISGSEVTVPDSPLFASHVKKGDIIFAATAGDETVKPERVASAVVKQMRGAYAPLTKEGNMIIDNVLVSCYAVVNDHNLAHNSFAPLRYLYDLLPGAIIGGSSKDIHWYPQLLMKIAEIFLDETSYYPMEIKEILNTTMY